MKQRIIHLLMLLTAIPTVSIAKGIKNTGLRTNSDTTEVIELNKKGYENRLSDPEQGLLYAKRALDLAKRLKYRRGQAEAYRVMGISKYYLNQTENAISDYLNSLSLFKDEHDRLGQARVYNNIGNLYIWADYDKALDYFNEALKLSKTLPDKVLQANLFLNIGNIFLRKKKYNQALNYYENGNKLYVETENEIGIIHCLQNRGKIYFELNRLNEAEKLLDEAYWRAKRNDLNGSIASINLTLTSIYILKKEFEKAERTLNEGIAFARLVKDDKLIYDFQYTSYELEYQRKNFERAIFYLRMVYKQDSINHKNSESAKIGLLQEQFRQKELQRENELIILKQKQNKLIFIATVIVSIMSIAVIILLVRNIRRKIRSNRELTRLNREVLDQKEDLNRINKHLEDIINERTKDLRTKNKKLSEYSSHLSHEIRGPVATMKGLLILEEERLIENAELAEKMRICINALDIKIHEINDRLHDPEVSGLGDA